MTYKRLTYLLLVLLPIFLFGIQGSGYVILPEATNYGIIVLVLSSLVVFSIIHGRNDRCAQISLVISTFSVSMFIGYIYYLANRVGEQGAGGVEGKFLGYSIALGALACIGLLSISFALGLRAFRPSSAMRKYTRFPLFVSIIGVIVVSIPLLISLLPLEIRASTGLDSWSWLSQVYKVANAL